VVVVGLLLLSLVVVIVVVVLVVVHPVSAGSLSPGIKRPGREANHSPASSAEVKNCGTVPPLHHTS
jgi:hypothetical protein